MAWLPFEKYTLTTPLTAAQVERKIAEAAGTVEYYSVAQLKNIIVFKTSDRFRLGGYYQSFKPGATVSIEATAAGNKLTVVLKPNIGAVAVLALIVLVLLAGIAFTQRTNLELGKYKDAIVAASCLLILSCLLPMTAFNGEAPILKQFISDFFEVEPEH